MLHILLFILKIIGILLLSILGLILLILALVLLVPVRYRAGLRMRTIADYSVDGKVSWLFGLICLTGGYDGEQVKLDIRIFGHSLLHKKPEKQKKRRKKPPQRQIGEQPAVREIKAEKENIEPKNTECMPIVEQAEPKQDEKTSVQEISDTEDGGTDADEAEQTSGTHEKNHIWQKLRNGSTRLSRLPSQIRQKVSSIGHTWKNLSKRKDRKNLRISQFWRFDDLTI